MRSGAARNVVGQRDRRSAVGEFEVNLCGDRVAVVANLVGLFADGLLEFVQREFALLDGIVAGRLLAKDLKGCDCQKEEDQGNRFSHA